MSRQIRKHAHTLTRARECHTLTLELTPPAPLQYHHCRDYVRSTKVACNLGQIHVLQNAQAS